MTCPPLVRKVEARLLVYNSLNVLCNLTKKQKRTFRFTIYIISNRNAKGVEHIRI